MKFRQGFVSNSSSSSFIIGLDKHPESSLELHKMLFGDEIKWLPDPYYNEKYDNMPSYSSAAVAQTVYNDLNKQEKVVKHDGWTEVRPAAKIAGGEEVIIELMTHGWFEGYPEYSWRKYEKSPSSLYKKELEKELGKSIYDYEKELKIWTAKNDRKKIPVKLQKYYDLQQKERDQQNKKVENAARKLWLKHKRKFNGKQIYHLTYSDNDGQYQSFLEHNCPMFDKIPCITISHH